MAACCNRARACWLRHAAACALHVPRSVWQRPSGSSALHSAHSMLSGQGALQEERLAVQSPIAMKPVSFLAHRMDRGSPLHGKTQMDLLKERGFIVVRSALLCPQFLLTYASPAVGVRPVGARAGDPKPSLGSSLCRDERQAQQGAACPDTGVSFTEAVLASMQRLLAGRGCMSTPRSREPAPGRFCAAVSPAGRPATPPQQHHAAPAASCQALVPCAGDPQRCGRPDAADAAQPGAVPRRQHTLGPRL